MESGSAGSIPACARGSILQVVRSDYGGVVKRDHSTMALCSQGFDSPHLHQ